MNQIKNKLNTLVTFCEPCTRLAYMVIIIVSVYVLTKVLHISSAETVAFISIGFGGVMSGGRKYIDRRKASKINGDQISE